MMFEITNSDHVNTLRKRIGWKRLASYDAEAGGTTAGSLLLYQWNTEVSAAFFASLQGFEVVLRNALAHRLAVLHSAFGMPGEWYDDPRGILDDRGRQDIAEARRRIVRQRRPVTPGRMVSELSFGFWRYLLTARYEQSLWTPALRHAFPGLRPQRRREVADRVARLHLMRNRLAHHEPLHRRDLTADFADLLFVTSAICPYAAAWIDGTSTVRTVVRQRPGGRPMVPRARTAGG